MKKQKTIAITFMVLIALMIVPFVFAQAPTDQFSIAVDDNSPVSDVILAVDVSVTLDNSGNILLFSEIDATEIEDDAVLAIYEGEAIIILGEDASSDLATFIVDVGYYLDDINVEYETILSNEVTSSDFRDLFVASKRTSPCGDYGDVDMDGYVTEADANLTLKYSINLIVLTDEQIERADVTANGEVTSFDAAKILKYANHITDTFPVCDITITPTERVPPCGDYGDVDYDGYITQNDVNIIGEIAAGIIEVVSSEQMLRADVTGNGEVTGTDASKVSRYLNGYLNTFPVCDDTGCTIEGDTTNPSLGPNYYVPCCDGLAMFYLGLTNDAGEAMVGSPSVCYDPEKGTPECDYEGTEKEGYFYPNGELLWLGECGDGAIIEEKVKCVFENSNEIHTCYNDRVPEYNCSAVEACIIDVSGKKGQELMWKSSCGGQVYTRIDGTNDYAKFDCSLNVEDDEEGIGPSPNFEDDEEGAGSTLTLPSFDNPSFDNKLSLFIMSDCPYAAKALKTLDILNSKFPSLDYRIDYIADDLGNGNFFSLHGDYEVEEDIRQICAKKLNSEEIYFDYILCRVDNGIKFGDWEDCAEEVGLDADKLDECVTGDLGPELLSQNVIIAKNLNIKASPTWVLNGNKFSGFEYDEVLENVCKFSNLCNSGTTMTDENSKRYSLQAKYLKGKIAQPLLTKKGIMVQEMNEKGFSQEIRPLYNYNGAQTKFLQLHKALVKAIVGQKEIISYIEDEYPEADVTELLDLNSALAQVFDELISVDIRNSEQEELTEMYVNFKGDAQELIALFKEEAHTILGDDDVIQLREQVRNINTEEMKTMSKDINQYKLKYNAGQVRETLEKVGIDDANLVNAVETGTITYGQIRSEIANKFKDLSQEIKTGAILKIKEARVKTEVKAQEIMQNMNLGNGSVIANQVKNRIATSVQSSNARQGGK